MFRSFNTSLLFLSCLFLLNSLSFAQTFNCDPANRPKYGGCENQPKEKTCGYHTEDCPLEVCAFNFMNGCEACSISIPEILYYEKTDCDPDLVVDTCSVNCDDTFDRDFDSFVTVCGIKRGEDQKLIKQTFDSACTLCEQSDFNYYHLGPCEEDRTDCQNDLENIFPEDTVGIETENVGSRDGPVCASFKAEDNMTAYVNVSSGFEACSDKAVKFYQEGACGPLKDDAVYCLPNNRPEACTEEINPVCAYYYSEDDGFVTYTIKDNPCLACAAPGIIYHIPGPCTFSVCDTRSNGEDCEELRPVCGRFQESGELRKESFTSCLNCQESTGLPIFQSDGLCPGDKGIRCENDPGTYIQGILNPVCGYFQEDCDINGPDCRKTYAEPKNACDAGSLYYTPGPCPGYNGVQCSDYNSRPDDPVTLYPQVCGYSLKDCNEWTCKGDFDDQYAACADPGTFSFTKGPC